MHAVQALNAAQKSADTQPNNLNGPNGNPNVYLSGGYGDSTAIPNDPSKTTAADPQQNTKVRSWGCHLTLPTTRTVTVNSNVEKV